MAAFERLIVGERPIGIVDFRSDNSCRIYWATNVADNVALEAIKEFENGVKGSPADLDRISRGVELYSPDRRMGKVGLSTRLFGRERFLNELQGSVMLGVNLPQASIFYPTEQARVEKLEKDGSAKRTIVLVAGQELLPKIIDPVAEFILKTSIVDLSGNIKLVSESLGQVATSLITSSGGNR